MIEQPPKNAIRRDIERYRGDRFRVEPSPAWVVRRKVMNIQRQPGEPVSMLLMDRQIHAPSNTRYTRIVRRLETHQAVQDLGTIELGFDPATQLLLIHGVSIFRAGNLVNHAIESAFELFQREAKLESDVLTGALTALLVLKDIRIGDVLDVEFSVTSDSELLGEHYWFTELIGNTFPIGRQWLSWIEREGQSLYVQAPRGLGTYERETSDTGNTRTWCFEHTPVLAPENQMPAALRPFPEIALTTFGNWAEVTALFIQPWNVEPANLGELEQELAPLRERFAADPIEGIAAAVDLVRHHVRYLGYSPGVFALVPANPADVWQRRFGDCKEKSRLLCWLLHQLGVEAHPILVNTLGGEALESLSPSPGAFDHVIVRVLHAGKELWIDPTDVARRGLFSTWGSLPFHFGLPLVAGSDQLVRIPGESPGASGLTVDEHVQLDSKTRGGTITVTHTYRGGHADQMRHAIDSRGRAAAAGYIADQVKQTRPDAQAASDLEVTDDPIANHLTLRCQFHCEELLKPIPERGIDAFFLVPYSIPPCVTGTTIHRKYPLAIQHPVDVKHTIRVNPDDPRKVVIPRQTTTNEFFTFSFTSTAARNETTHVFTFQTRTGTVPIAKIRAYSSDLSKVAAALDWHIGVPPRGRRPLRMRPSDSSSSW